MGDNGFKVHNFGLVKPLDSFSSEPGKTGRKGNKEMVRVNILYRIGYFRMLWVEKQTSSSKGHDYDIKESAGLKALIEQIECKIAF